MSRDIKWLSGSEVHIHVNSKKLCSQTFKKGGIKSEPGVVGHYIEKLLGKYRYL